MLRYRQAGRDCLTFHVSAWIVSQLTSPILPRVSLMIVRRRLLLSLAGALLCTAASLTPVGAQQPTGTITGQVIDSATRQPLGGVNVVVEGTGLGAITHEDGTFSILGVPAGTHTLRARRIGYASVPVVVNVSEGSAVSGALVRRERAAGVGGDEGGGEVTPPAAD